MSELMSIKKWFPSHVAAGVSGAGHGIGGDLPCPHFILSDILKSKITFYFHAFQHSPCLHIHIQEPQKRALDRESCSSSFPSKWMLKNVLYTVYCTGGTLHLSLVTPESAGIWIIARVSSLLLTSLGLRYLGGQIFLIWGRGPAPVLHFVQYPQEIAQIDSLTVLLGQHVNS